MKMFTSLAAKRKAARQAGANEDGRAQALKASRQAWPASPALALGPAGEVPPARSARKKTKAKKRAR